jgi:ABC-2 type transport system ATP-binding protein
VILSSHLLADVEDVCDRVVIYYGGKVQAMGTLKELLATPDAIRITMPPLPRETMQSVLNLIRADVAEDKIRIDNPTQNLESYFLGVVERAKQAVLETSGATSGSKVAAYLRGDAEAGPATDKILERLTLPAAAVREERPPEVERAPPLDQARLEALTRPAEPALPAAAPAPASAQPVDLSQANEKLSSLLNKPK